MQERRIDPAEGLQIRRLLAHAFPLFIVPVMALFAVFRSDEDFFDFRHPVGRSLTSVFCAMARLMIQADNADQRPA